MSSKGDKEPEKVENPEEKAPEAPVKETIDETPGEKAAYGHSNKPGFENNESPEVENEAKNEYMNTFPAAPMNDYHNFNDSNGFPKNKTHDFFNPRRTYHSKSTERGMKHYAQLNAHWDNRFHVSPSINNRKSHTFYKQFFNKPTRTTQK